MLGAAFCTANFAEVVNTPPSAAPTACSVTDPLATEHFTKKLAVLAPSATVTDVVAAPPDDAANVHVLPLALNANDSPKPDGAVLTVNANGVPAADSTLFSSVPPSAPPVIEGCAA
jgi:hypothetical protein